jgi:APA family basic amino acid/polyamine antiporter
VISCFGALNGWILLSGQIPLAVAKDRLFPERFGRVSSNGTPVFGLVVSGLLASLVMVLNYTRGLVDMFTFIILLATLTTLVPYVFTAGAELLLLVREPEKFDARRIRGYATVAVLALAYSFWAIWGAGRDTVFYGFLLVMSGVPVYVWIQWARSRVDRA